jgi:ferric-dicitrate binding protein FerR (iron transport regulator)
MNCEQAQLLISAMIDEEISPADRARLKDHLRDCSACQAAADATEHQDAELRALFASRQPAVTAVIERVIAELPAMQRRTRRSRGWVPVVASLVSAAAGFTVALLLLRPWLQGPPQIVEKVIKVPVDRIVERERPVIDPVLVVQKDAPELAKSQAHLSLATGPVEMLSEDDQDWRVMQTGATIGYGTCVRTPPQTRCEFRCPDGSEVRLNGGTKMCFLADRKFRVEGGQLYAAATKGETPFEVESPDAIVTTVGTQFDLACRPQKDRSETIVTVIEGKTRVEGKGKSKSKEAEAGLELSRGEMATIVDGEIADKRAAYQLVQATDWVHELLVLKGRDNPELAKRVNAMLAELGQTKLDFLNDAEIRSLGDRCVLPLIRFVESPESAQRSADRRHAMQILADLAQPWAIPELINLLADSDKEVRYQAAKSLQRLAGQNDDVPHALPPSEWRDRPVSACTTERQRWECWWKANEHRYPKAR